MKVILLGVTALVSNIMSGSAHHLRYPILCVIILAGMFYKVHKQVKKQATLSDNTIFNAFGITSVR